MNQQDFYVIIERDEDGLFIVCHAERSEASLKPHSEQTILIDITPQGFFAFGSE